MRADVERAVELLQQQRPDSLERALALLQQTVFAFSMKICGQREDAEDTMQDVLLKSVPYLPKFTSPKALVVWLYTVAKNRCLMSRRRSKFAPKENLSLDELMPDRRELQALVEGDHAGPEQSVLRDENAGRVQQAVLKVPPQYRLILVLHDMEELTTEEIAKITGLRPGTVRVRLHRARLFVRRELARTSLSRGGAHAPSRVRSSAAKAKMPRPAECRAMFAALSDYLDDELPDHLCEQLRQHMGSCEPCLAFLETLRDAVARVHTLTPGKPDPTLAAEVRDKLLPQVHAAMGRMKKNKAAAR
jgi:RNA polymerase sigma-70 factor, ECF subfamily